jgi:hypothetical protein
MPRRLQEAEAWGEQDAPGLWFLAADQCGQPSWLLNESTKSIIYRLYMPDNI